MTDDTKAWLNSQHQWLQEAAYRILSKGKIDDVDIPDLVALIKAPQLKEGTVNPKDRVYPDFGSGSASSTLLRLLSIGEVVGIETLEPKHPLTFGKGNLTVVYGNNGSGKSGYIRILKKACGKAGAAGLKPNVYKASPDKQHCTISFSIDGAEKTTPWVANSAPIPALSAVDIFDTSSGRVYIEGESEVAYKPAELALFSDIVGMCNKVDAALAGELANLITSLPEMPSKYHTTKASKQYAALSSTITHEKLSVLYPWKPEDEKTLKLHAEKLKIANPIAEANKRRSVKVQIDGLNSKLQGALSSITCTTCQQLRDLVRAARAARQAATEGAKVVAPSSKLEGVASATWRTLWEAAREYSTSAAYPGQPHPYVEDGALCVLCHQELNTDAKRRLIDFENFISGRLESAATTAEDLATKMLDSLPKKPDEDIIRTQCQAAELPVDSIARLISIWAEIANAADSLRADPFNENIKYFNASECPLVAELSGLSKAAETDALSFDGHDTGFDRKQVEDEVLELEAKQWTSQQVNAITAEIKRLKKRDALKEWRRATETTGISKRASKLSETLITENYVARFNNELEKLGAKHISVELIKTGATHGQVKHRIQLRGSRLGASPGEILSEGESRIVSLAAFLADVTGKPTNAPFLFDDPISSLDHEYEWAVATRLTALASARQVIVFTHRLSLYGGLEDAARKAGETWKKEHLKQQCIEAFGGSHGHPVEDTIWTGSTKKANNILIAKLGQAKGFWDAGDSSNYRTIAQSICSDFRKLLERTIEEDLLSKVVLRHRRSVTTENRIKLLAKISLDDCAYFDDLMTKYSCYEHSQSKETPISLPDEPSLRGDVEGLNEWRSTFTSRV
jgi:energy-coupling factor transporter ATP-binding protein EcfA2